MREIYNEGRVVGISAYGLYVRQLLSIDPEATPMTEREWLTFTLANNASMIMKVTKGTTQGYHDYILPEGSSLCGSATMYGSLFQGQVRLGEDGIWANRVNDYGPLIDNTAQRSPETPGQPEDVPAKEDPIEPFTPLKETELRNRAKEYVKIVSAIMVQPGDWIQRENEEGKDLDPNFAERGFVRLLLSDDLNEDVYILICGFVDKLALKGEFSFIPDAAPYVPANGDFLGPAMFPWAVPIVLISSTDVDKFARDDIDLIREREHYLGTFHSAKWDTPVLNEEGIPLTTEDEDILLTTVTGTVADMWDDQDASRPYYPIVPYPHNVEE